VRLLQVRGRQVKIFLCRYQRGMAQQFLNVANIHAVIQAVRCAAVSENMRVYASDSSALRGGNDHPVDSFLPERLFVGAARWQFTCEKGIERDACALPVRDFVIAQANASHDALSGFASLSPPAPPHAPLSGDTSALAPRVLQEKSARRSTPQIGPQSCGRWCPEETDSVLAAFSLANNQAPRSEVHVLDAKVCQFVDAQAGSIAKLHNRQVPRSASGSYQPSNFSLALDGWQAFREFPPNQVAWNRGAYLPTELQTIAQATQCVQSCLQGARGESPWYRGIQ